MATELSNNQNNATVSISEYTAQIDADIKRFELQQRKAHLLSNSTIVPLEYRARVEDKMGNLKDNPNALSNCVIAIDMALRMNANELMIMQNLSIIQGRPSWSSQWIIGAINTCGKYTALKFETKKLGEKKLPATEIYWENKVKNSRLINVTIEDMSCIAYATEKSTGDRLESAEISLKMAVEEGWYTKPGSKWKTMPEIMLRYRAASFFGKIYAPELLMGIQSVEENVDIGDGDLSSKYKDVITINEQTTNNKFKPVAKDEKNTKEETVQIKDEVQQDEEIVTGDLLNDME